MPITKCAASKATPAKGIEYIMDPEKVIAKGSQGFVTNDPKQMARQMLQTMHLFGKGFDPDERKYYHAKVAFDPKDRPENGGTLDPAKANAYAAKYATKTWPGREVVWAVQDHGASIHVHFIVAACEQETGKKLDARDAEYRAWKDQAQELAEEMNLSTLDWRKATKKKREREKQSEFPVEETFAEQGYKTRGKITWKDELRDIIDQAAGSCSSMAEFRADLESRGVILTRCTEQTISYKLGDHKACRGDSLGGDYTIQAIRSALGANHRAIVPEPESGKEHIGLDFVIGGAEKVRQAADAGGRVISQHERKVYREFGRLAGVKRSEIDEYCDMATKATWEEKIDILWQKKGLQGQFWNEFNARKEKVNAELNAAYKLRRQVKDAEWAINPKNRRSSLLSVIIASIFLSKNDSSAVIETRIQKLKQEKQRLSDSIKVFKSGNENAIKKLTEQGLSLDEYQDALREMQDAVLMVQGKSIPKQEKQERKRFSEMTEEEQFEFYSQQLRANQEFDRRKNAWQPINHGDR